MKRTLTDTWLKSATSGGKVQMDFFDGITPGLAIRISKAGKKTWNFAFTPPGSATRTRLSLGTYPATDLVNARLRASEARAHVEAGRDPRLIRPETKKTVAQLVDDRIAFVLRRDADNYVKTCMEQERMYDVDVIPVVGGVALADFRIAHLNLILNPIILRGSNIQANRVFECVRALFNYAVEMGEIEFSPIAKAKKRSKENVRERNLGLEEIKTLWATADDVLGRSDHVPLILKIALATSKRVGEIAGMRREEIHQGEKLWTIPKCRIKGKADKVQDEIVPLSDLALSLIGQAMRGTNGSLLFPRKDGEAGTTSSTVSHAVERAQERFGMAQWTPHDLRRTVGTQMLNQKNGLGITRFSKYLALNHLSAIYANVSDKVYDQNDYLDEKREALDKWGAFLAKLVGEEIALRVAA